MKEYDGLTPSESERYEELIRTAYPQPSPDMKEKVMARIAAEYEKRRRRSQFIMKCGSLAACLVILSVVTIKALPLLSDKKLANHSDMVYFSDDSDTAVGYNFNSPADADDDSFNRSESKKTETVPESNCTDDAEVPYGNAEDSHDDSGIRFVAGNSPVTPDEAVNAYNIACNALNNDALAVGGNDMFDREYRDEVYNVAYLTNVYADEEAPVSEDALQLWTEEKLLSQTTEEQDATPTLYQAVRELGVSKETLIALNDSRKARADGNEMVLSDEVIDALYLEEDEMKLALTNTLALNYNGKIYSFNDIQTMSAEQALDDGIPPEVMVEYVERVVTYCVENGILTEETIEKCIETDQ